MYLSSLHHHKSLACVQLPSVRFSPSPIVTAWDNIEEGGQGGSREPPQGQGWNALAGTGRQAQHIWRLKVTSSPCRHPSAQVLECVSSTKYSVCRGPVNAWQFLTSARWRTRLAGSAGTHTHTHTHTQVSFDLQETCSSWRTETKANT